MSTTQLRSALVAVARSMNSSGLNQGTSGNVSVRCGDRFLLTPSALPYEACGPQDMVDMGMDGSYLSGGRKPSTEWRIHRDIYTNHPDAGCVLHAHSVWCTTLACLEVPIPAFHYMVAVAGGDSIPCAPYAPFGSQELSDALLHSLDGRRACLLAHHGMVCFSRKLDNVLALATEIEALAKMYVHALPIAPPPLLSQSQMAEVLDRFADYKP